MKSKNYAKFEFPAKSCNEAFARSCVAAFAAQLDPTIDELGDIKTSVSEAVTNAVVHAYPSTLGTIYLKLRILGEDTIEITVKDRGKGIEDVKMAMEPLFTTGGDDRSGMGFTIMDSFMDKMKVTSRPGKGTSVVMCRRIRAKNELE
ncbi:MAG: anti-sigma F factor [Oscillospiraceae bacterium]|nr:anti-sigma F factor [Oscillospiraceae bacterium]